MYQKKCCLLILKDFQITEIDGKYLSQWRIFFRNLLSITATHIQCAKTAKSPSSLSNFCIAFCFQALREFKNLKKNFLRFIWIDDILRELVYLKNLKDLRLPQCNIHKNKVQEAKFISKLENLEWLDLTNTSEWFTDLTLLVNLRALRLQHNSYVTDLYILDLTEHCTHLTYLNISGEYKNIIIT